MHTFRLTSNGRDFFRPEPIIGAIMNVFAPSIRRKSEVLGQKLGQFSGCFSREHTLYHVLVVGISFRLPQEDPPTRLGAEYVLAPVFGENVRSILARSAGT